MNCWELIDCWGGRALGICVLLPGLVVANDLKYDPAAAQQERLLADVQSSTAACLHDAALMALRGGAQDSALVIDFGTRLCGGPLFRLLTEGTPAKSSVEAQAILEAMARAQLAYIPGLSWAETDPSAGTPKSNRREAGKSETKPSRTSENKIPTPVYPQILNKTQALELGELVLLLMPETDMPIGWDYRAASRITWLTDGYRSKLDGHGVERIVREGVVRVHVAGTVATVVRTQKMELGWTVTYVTSELAKFGPMKAEVRPGTPEEGCFGSLYDRCDFDPMPSLRKASIGLTEVCRKEWNGGTGKIVGLRMTHPARSPTYLRWMQDGGSGGMSTDLEVLWSPDLSRLCK